MSGAVATPVASNGHDDDEPPPRLPHDLSARGAAEEIVALHDKAETAINDVRELRARVDAHEASAEQRAGWLLEALRHVGDEVLDLKSTLAGMADHVKTATGDTRRQLDSLTEEDAAQDLAIAAAHERNARLESELSATKAQAALALKLAAWKWTAIAGASAAGVLFALRAAGLVHF